MDSFQWNTSDYIKLTIGPLQHAKVFSCFRISVLALLDHHEHGGSHWQQDDEVALYVLGGLESV